MKIKITLGKSVKGKVFSSVETIWSSLFSSLGCSVLITVRRSVSSSINNSTRWEIKL